MVTFALGLALAGAGGAWAAGEDVTPPSWSCEIGPAELRWQRDNIGLLCFVTDAESGVQLDPWYNDYVNGIRAFNLWTQAGHGEVSDDVWTNSRRLCDNARNCTTAGPLRGFKVDGQPPVLDCDRTGFDEPWLSAPWRTANVSFPCTVNDFGGSGLVGYAEGATVFAASTVLPGEESENALATTPPICDNVRRCVWGTFAFKIDMKPPQVMCEGGSPDGAWHPSNVTFACTSTDLTGYQMNDEFTVSTTVGPASDDADAFAAVPVMDKVGNVTVVEIGPNKIDKKAPESAIRCGAMPGAPCSETRWYGRMPISFSASDGSGSGVTGVYYTTDGSDPGPANGAFLPNGDTFALGGSATIEYRAVDAVGNLQGANAAAPSRLIRVDTDPPTTGAVRCDGDPCSPTSVYRRGVRVDFAIEDGAGSGAKGVYFTTDGSEPSPGNGRFVAAGESISLYTTSAIRYRAVDRVGNLEAAAAGALARVIRTR
jgi:Chitobiase/beta-hexosaminidase C-terminal domain